MGWQTASKKKLPPRVRGGSFTSRGESTPQKGTDHVKGGEPSALALAAAAGVGAAGASGSTATAVGGDAAGKSEAESGHAEQ